MTSGTIRMYLGLLISLGLLVKSGHCTIQILKRQNGTILWDPVYTISDYYQSIVGQRNMDSVVFLKAADPPDACKPSEVASAPRLWVDDERILFFLLLDDDSCTPRKGKQSKLTRPKMFEKDDTGFPQKIISAQKKGYSGVIVYASLFKDRTNPADSSDISLSSWPIRSRTKPFPVVIPQDSASRIKIDVYFIGYDDGKHLTKFAYDPSSEARYRVDVPLLFGNVESEAADVGDILPVNLNWTAYQSFNDTGSESTPDRDLATTFQPDVLRGFLKLYGDPADPDTWRKFITPREPLMNVPQPQWRMRSADAAKLSDGAFYAAIIVPLSVVAFIVRYGLPYLYRRRQLRVAAERLRAAQALADEEIAQHLAFRQHLVQRFIEAFMAQIEAAEQQDYIRANGTPLTTTEMDQLNHLQVTDPSDDICTTCQQAFSVGEMKVVLPCSHAGHTPCLTTWLTTYSRNCPVCRQPVRVEAVIASPPACTFPVELPDSPVPGRQN